MRSDVAVYHVRDLDHCDQFLRYELKSTNSLTVYLDLISAVAVEGSGLLPVELAARAWVEVVGRVRQQELLEMNAAAWIADEQVSLHLTIAGLREAPIAFPGLSGFFYDNMVESWFISIDSESTSRREPFISPATFRFCTCLPTTAAALLRSLRVPPLN
jgi:hypothetical protein